MTKMSLLCRTASTSWYNLVSFNSFCMPFLMGTMDQYARRQTFLTWAAYCTKWGPVFFLAEDRFLCYEFVEWAFYSKPVWQTSFSALLLPYKCQGTNCLPLRPLVKLCTSTTLPHDVLLCTFTFTKQPSIFFKYISYMQYLLQLQSRISLQLNELE